jgi:hypothetical protein
VTPPAPAATWEHVNSVQRALLLTPDSSTLTTTAYAPDAADDLTDKDSHHRQYVSDPLKAQTLSGNLKGQFQCLEELANCNLFLTVKVLVCSNDGSTTQATLLAITRDTTNELATSLTNRNFPSTALSSFACADGDRLVLEIGLGGSITSGTGGVVGHNGSIRWGCSAAGGDLPEDDAATGTTLRPWMEFSNTIKWLAASDGNSQGVAASVVAGAALWATLAAASGVAAATAVGDVVRGDATSLTVLTWHQPQASRSATWQAFRQHQIAAEFVAGPVEADGAADGVATVSGIGGATWSEPGTSAGVATVAGVGAAQWNADGVSAGVATVTGLSHVTAGVVATSAGSATVLGNGENAAAGASAHPWWGYRRRLRRSV